MEFTARPNWRLAVRTTLHVIDGAVRIPEIRELIEIIASTKVSASSIDNQYTGFIILIQIIHHQV